MGKGLTTTLSHDIINYIQRKELIKMAKWEVEIFDSAVYPGIEADTREEAEHIAWDWFQERKPNIVVRQISDD